MAKTVWVGLVVILVWFLVSQGALGRFYSQRSSQVAPLDQSEKPSLPDYVKRNFDASRKFMYQVDVAPTAVRQTTEELAGVEYPTELTTLKDQELVGLKCSPLFRDDYENGYEFNDLELGTSRKLLDQRTLGYLQQVTTQHQQRPSSFQICDTEDDQTLVTYTLGDKHYFATLTNNSLTLKTSVYAPKGPYVACYQALALTINGFLYYVCGGADGGFAQASILKIAMAKGGVSTLLSCTQQASGEAIGRKITCE